MPNESQTIERILRIIARTVATHPAGRDLLLIGGFRFRLLDQSARFSRDIDYHWDGDLTLKQEELVRLCRRAVIPLVRRQFGLDGEAKAWTGPETEGPNARFVRLAFWKLRIPYSRIEVPLEITRVLHLDPIMIRTAEGVVYPTLSDSDMIEAKILAILNRVYLEHRDLVDLFLYGHWLGPDAARRLKEKLQRLGLSSNSIKRRLNDLDQYPEYHARAVEEIIGSQLDPVAAANVRSGGGGRTVLDQALKQVHSLLPEFS